MGYDNGGIVKILGIHLFHHFHTLYVKEKYMFEGKPLVKDSYTGYRICLECKKIQKYLFDSQGGNWYFLRPNEQEIIHKKLESGIMYSV